MKVLWLWFNSFFVEIHIHLLVLCDFIFIMFFSLFSRQRVSHHRQREASYTRPAVDSTQVSRPSSSHLLSDDPHDRPFRGERFKDLLKESI